MRWDELRVEEQESRQLPGYRDPAAVRTFDAPEALDTRFYEVRARSALNRLPKASRMPFRWTVNPYRGCAHACVYCMDGATPVLMADSGTRPLGELRPGDAIVGTVRAGRYRRYVETTVLDHWSSIGPAYRVTLADGTELVASGDHRFLTERGFKHVAPAQHGRRPHLTTSNALRGTGRFARPPARGPDYRRGYRAGLTGGPPAGRPDDEWRRGFLAGAYDATGGCDSQSLRIAAADVTRLALIADCLRLLGFDVAVDRPARQRVAYLRVRGGLRERLRFLHLVEPERGPRPPLAGAALTSDSDLRVMAVEPLAGERLLFDVTTGTGDFIADGVVSHNCFARPTHKYLDLSPGRDFEREIVVKVNAPEALAADLAKPSWRREHVALGTNTDPYQWVEGRYRLMPGIWTALRDARTPCSVLTKSPLLLRDLELLRELAELVGFTASLSVPTLDERAWRASEPRTPNPRARLEAVAELNRAGVPTGVMVAPLMPGINDDPRQVEEILALAGEAGATGVGGICLHLRGEVRGIFMDWLRSYRPDLVSRYERLYADGAYAPPAERKRIAALTRHRSDSWPRAFRRRPPRPTPPDPPPPDQPTLF